MPSVTWGWARRSLTAGLSSCGGVPNGAVLAPLPMEAERLATGFEARDEARPLAEVDRAGETKVSVLGEEAGGAGVEIGTAVVAVELGRPSSMTDITLAMTCFWLSDDWLSLDTSQKTSRSLFEASIRSS